MNSGNHARITLKDVAQKSGYTANTVSRALRGDARIPVSTRELICRVADEMGYIPNQLASTLRSGTSHTVAVIVNNIQNQHFALMLGEMESALRDAGYSMTILCTQQDEKLGEQMLQVAIAQHVDGILYFPFHSNKKHIEYLEQNHVPFVLLDRWIPGIYADTSRCDDEMGGYLAGKHLCELGHRRFLYLAGTMNNSSQYDRYSGFLRALEEWHISQDSVRSVPYFDIEAAAKEGRVSSLLEPMDYTAIISFCDEHGYHALLELYNKGIRVPEDMSIISFDHIREGVPFLPRLSSIAEGEQRVANTAVRLLLNKMRNPELPVRIEVLPVRIFDEGTTGPARMHDI